MNVVFDVSGTAYNYTVKWSLVGLALGKLGQAGKALGEHRAAWHGAGSALQGWCSLALSVWSSDNKPNFWKALSVWAIGGLMASSSEQELWHLHF